ncbi:MAG: hypothetical protein U0350_31675 [Caldilineaceae bacterium]
MGNGKPQHEWQFSDDEALWQNQPQSAPLITPTHTAHKKYQVVGLILLACLIVLITGQEGNNRQQPVGNFHDQTELQQRTDHFNFHFRRRDAATVRLVAPLIEQQYAALRQAVGLGEPAPDEMIRIDIGLGATQATWLLPTPAVQTSYTGRVLSQNQPELWKLQVICMFGAVPPAPNMPESMPEKCPTVASLHFSNNRFALPSPSADAPPPGVSATTMLTQSLTYLLAGRVLDERLHDAPMAPGWRPMLQAIRWWLGWNGPLPPPVWIDQASMAADPKENATQRYLADEQIIAARSLVDYAIKVYGCDKLPRLIAAFSQSDSWQTLIPAVFGVSAEQFEQGWQRYVAAQTDRSVP